MIASTLKLWFDAVVTVSTFDDIATVVMRSVHVYARSKHSGLLSAHRCSQWKSLIPRKKQRLRVLHFTIAP